MREYLVLALFALVAAAPAAAQPLYDQGPRGPSNQQGAGYGYVSPYNEPSRLDAPTYGSGSTGGHWGTPAPRYDLLAPRPVPQPYYAPSPYYDDRYRGGRR